MPYVTAPDGTVHYQSESDQAFDAWMEQVDEVCQERVGCSVYDLADYMFRDAFDEHMSPGDVVQDLIDRESIGFYDAARWAY